MFQIKLPRIAQRETLRNNVISRATPLFPIGIPRSGTTFLAKALNSHPEVLMTNETAVFIQLNEIIKKSQEGIKAGILYGKQYHSLWAEHLSENAKPLIEGFYNKIYSKNKIGPIKYWGDKHPHHNLCFDFIQQLYPNAIFIYIVRDPRDVTCSIAEMNNVPFLKAFNTWKMFARNYETFVGTLNNSQIYYLRYEDLVDNYEKSTQRILNWLGLDYSINVQEFLEYYKHVDAHTYNLPNKEMHEKVAEDFSVKSTGRWKRDLPSFEQKTILQEAEEYLHRHNYI